MTERGDSFVPSLFLSRIPDTLCLGRGKKREVGEGGVAGAAQTTHKKVLSGGRQKEARDWKVLCSLLFLWRQMLIEDRRVARLQKRGERERQSDSLSRFLPRGKHSNSPPKKKRRKEERLEESFGHIIHFVVDCESVFNYLHEW